MPIGKMDVFDMENGDWNLYIQRFEIYCEANSIVNRKPALIILMGEAAFEVLNTLAYPENVEDLRYDDVVDLMEEYLTTNPSFMEERYRFRQFKQGDCESVMEYVAALKKQAMRCNFGVTLDENLRDQLVYGLYNEELRNAVFREKKKMDFKRVVQVVHCLRDSEPADTHRCTFTAD